MSHVHQPPQPPQPTQRLGSHWKLPNSVPGSVNSVPKQMQIEWLLKLVVS